MDNQNIFTGYTPTWCSGCGNWGIGRSIMTALTQLSYTPSDVMMFFDIGCSGNMNDFINAYAMHTLHGRSIPCAIGAKIANHTMPVIVTGGDGSLYGEGGNHLLHACRGNHDITVIVHDNGVYGLTTGQVSPSAKKGNKSKSTPQGVIEIPLHPLPLALTQGATFVAQAFAGNIPHLVEMIKKGIAHKGLSLINVLQPCVTFNKTASYAYYFQHTYQLQQHDSQNLEAALTEARNIEQERFPLGVLYEIKKPTYTDHLPQLEKDALVRRDLISMDYRLFGI